MKVRFWDFDGTLFDTPLPEVGRDIWLEKTGNKYPHTGWWGRVESMDLTVFDIKPIQTTLKMLNDDLDDKTIDYVLTSRLSKFTDIIKELLDRNNIKVRGVMTKNKYDKGERIFQTVNELIGIYDITDVYFYDDRDKEILSANQWKSDIETLGVKFHITKIISDNHK